MGDDAEDEEDEVDETIYEKEEPPKKKGKVIIIRPIQSFPIVYTRREAKFKENLKSGNDEA